MGSLSGSRGLIPYKGIAPITISGLDCLALKQAIDYLQNPENLRAQCLVQQKTSIAIQESSHGGYKGYTNPSIQD